MPRRGTLINSCQYVSAPYIKENTIEYRSYQEKIVREVDAHNALIILPTGLGKTLIAVRIIAKDLAERGGKALMIASSKPLVNQHKKTFEHVTTIEPIIELTGETPLAKRKELWKSARVIIATPQTVEHDIIAENFDPRELSVVCFDEAHHSVGNHSYAFVARELKKKNPSIHILGITASPGHEKEKVREIVENLGIDKIIIRTENDPDVRPYVMGYSTEWRRVSLWPDMKKALELLKDLESRLKKKLREIGLTGLRTKKDILNAFSKVREMEKKQLIENEQAAAAMMSIAQLVLVLHAIELLETQGVSQMLDFILSRKEDVRSGRATKSTREFLKTLEIHEVERLLTNLKSVGMEHPKIEELKKILTTIESRVIVFTHYRGTALLLNKHIADSRVLLGHGTRGGVRMTQKEQLQTVEAFKRGEFRVLITTSVGEEGLDIAECDYVIFYEPIPSAIRSIQRKGRTGRKSPGKVIILITEGTRDEGYYWSAKRKEKAMKEIVENHGEILSAKQLSLDSFAGTTTKDADEVTNEQLIASSGKEIETTHTKEAESDEKVMKQPPQSIEEITEINSGSIDGNTPSTLIYVDARERGSNIVRKLYEMGDKIIITTLDAGDFVVAHDVAVEYKSMEDFSNSIVDGRVFDEIMKLKNAYEHPVIVVSKGSPLRGISLSGLLGTIASLMADYGVPVYISEDDTDAALFVHTLAHHRQREKKGSFSPRKFKPDDPQAQLVYIVAGIPHVGINLAERLLEKFGTVQNIANASINELMEVEGIGETLARKIYNILRRKYRNERAQESEDRGT
ncbi:MAG: helicase-related protein [Candidatus Korarchaeota archaeon]